MEITPLHSNIIIKPKAVEAKSVGGIVLGSETVIETRGEVLACGPGLTMPNGLLKPTTVDAGDEVIYAAGPTAQNEVLNGVAVLIMPESDILAIIKH